jgi:hypothetical protein
VHAPSRQISEAPHAVPHAVPHAPPHAPQFVTSLSVKTHASPHSVSGAWHVGALLPLPPPPVLALPPVLPPPEAVPVLPPPAPVELVSSLHPPAQAAAIIAAPIATARRSKLVMVASSKYSIEAYAAGLRTCPRCRPIALGSSR